ncbi:FRG superfamily protein [Psychroflexus torquis ATCC 700755]|uniref:FRG superfamily protein n=1 Tax=Psychroflexus torquis (strain ATCC 700755 / CIP 106069 / ACAM 623) TaxID=313595 RepID=K4IHE8_PSYTT|nr:FRG domain-containing protein [Psychroflexus torquis]AFU69962.1 FRG superfamily protein [Psychroflexus torquis ATCC 700755]
MNEEKSVKTVSEFIDLMHEKIANISTPNEIKNIWFRGEGNNNFLTPLVPKAFRQREGHLNNKLTKTTVFEDVLNIEGSLKSSFFREAEMFLNKNGINNNDWNKYFLMQHYGMQTRLLDWTESALIALYFSISDNHFVENDSVVWLLSPHNYNKLVLNQLSNGIVQTGSIYFPQRATRIELIDEKGKLNLDELFRMYLNLDFEHNHESYEKEFYPLAIYPYHLDERMRNQKSCFTIFGNEVNGILDFKDNHKYLAKIIIDKNSKLKIRKELELLGVSERDVYPDLSGISRSIENKYNF